MVICSSLFLFKVSETHVFLFEVCPDLGPGIPVLLLIDVLVMDVCNPNLAFFMSFTFGDFAG